MAIINYRMSMIGFYKIRMSKDLYFTADLKFGNEDKDSQKSSIKLALLAVYEKIDGTLRNHGITLDDMPDMISCFMAGRPYKDLELKFVEFGPKQLRFLVAVTSYESDTIFAIELPYGDTCGSISISDSHGCEEYVLRWRHGLLNSIRQTINCTQKVFQIRFSRRTETMSVSADLSDAIVTVVEDDLLPARKFHDDD